jgi:hypothetical protein
MTINPRPAFRPQRAALVGLLLVLTLGLAAGLAYEACHAAASHQAIASGILRDYVETATSEFARYATKELEITVMSVIKSLPHLDTYLPLRRFDPILGTFRIDLTGKRVLSTTVDLPSPVLDRLVDSGLAQARTAFPTVTDLAQSRSVIPKAADAAQARKVFLKATDPAVVIVDNPRERRVFGFVVMHDEENGSDELVGFETTAPGLAKVFRNVYGKAPLLMRALMRSAPNADGTLQEPARRSDADGVRPPAGAAAAPGHRRFQGRTPEGGVGPLGRRPHPHRRHPRRGTAPENRRRARPAPAHPHGPEGRLPPGAVAPAGVASPHHKGAPA